MNSSWQRWNGAVKIAYGIVARAFAMLLASGIVLPAHAAPSMAGVDPGALAAMERVAEFFSTRLSISGGFVYSYSSDLSIHRGEGIAEQGLAWNQPPGTPAVGGAFLILYQLTEKPQWMAAAAAAAHNTMEGQLLSGGWYNFTDTRTAGRREWCYRSVVAGGEECKDLEGHKQKNTTTLDDNITQSNLGFLLWYDEVSGGSDPAVRDAIEFGLSRLLQAQYPSGAWPTVLKGRPRPVHLAASRAKFPAAWPRTWDEPQDHVLVLNDNLVRDVIRLLLAAERNTGRADLLAAAKLSGDFLLASQMPHPQRGWAQGYNLDLEPVWGRKFEPPALASRETAGSIEALLQLYLRTAEQRYLTGAVEAAEWLRSSRRQSGDWARFYELESNRPLFVDADGALTYDDANLHEGYGFTGEFGIPSVLELVDRVSAGEQLQINEGWDWIFEPAPAPGDELGLVLSRADAEGRIVEDGWIHSATFVQAARSLWQGAQGGHR